MTKTEMKRLKVAVSHLEKAYKALAGVLGHPPVGYEGEHPVSAVEVALHQADQALIEPETYYLKPRKTMKTGKLPGY